VNSLFAPTHRYLTIAFSAGVALIAALATGEPGYALAVGVGFLSGAVAVGLSVLSRIYGRLLAGIAPILTVAAYKALLHPGQGVIVSQAGQFFGGILVGASVAGAIDIYAVRRRKSDQATENVIGPNPTAEPTVSRPHRQP
jgi:hypothetical protein